MLALMILSGVIAACFVHALNDISPRERADRRSRPGFWADEQEDDNDA